MNDCIFCKVVTGETPAHKIYEDEHTLAFLDINPVNQGHTLVIPKNHSRNVHDIGEADWLTMMKTVQTLSSKIKKGVAADGINIEMNNERPAGQIIFHSHVHIVPRLDDDGFRHWPGTPYKDGEAEEVAKKIKSAL